MTRQLLFPYLLNEQFEVGNRAPLDAVRAAQPGPGNLTMAGLTQLSIDGGALQATVPTVDAWGGQGFITTALARIGGRAFITTLNFPDAFEFMVGWTRTNTVNFSGYGNVANALYPEGGGVIRLPEALSQGVGNVGTFVPSTSYQYANILRAAGAFHLIKGGIFTNWTLLWVAIADNTATVYGAFGNRSAAGIFDNARVVDLPLPWTDDYGIATQRLAGAVAAGSAFVHEADCFIEYIVTTLPASGDIAIDFRKQDANNLWSLQINPAGNIVLYEVVGGVFTNRGSAAASVQNGDRIVIRAAVHNISIYEANAFRFGYVSAVNFSTATAGAVGSLGTGGVVSDLISWPRTLSGQALSTLVMDRACLQRTLVSFVWRPFAHNIVQGICSLGGRWVENIKCATSPGRISYLNNQGCAKVAGRSYRLYPLAAVSRIFCRRVNHMNLITQLYNTWRHR